ncbi:MAG: hypothetical protein AAF799_18295 [Myxococcota bacterium]
MAAPLAMALIALSPAQSPTLHWNAPSEACPSQARVSARLDSLLGSRTVALRARAQVVPHGTGWRGRLRITWDGQTDERVLDAADCEALANAITLLVAVMGDPIAVSHAVELPAVASTLVPPPPLEVQATATEPSGSADAEAVTHPAPNPTRRPSRFDRGASLQVAAWGDLGSLSRLSFGPSLGLAWRRPRWRARLEALYLPPQRVPSTEPEAGRGRVQVVALRAGACVRLGVPAVEVPLCGLTEAGMLVATHFGPDADRRAGDPWVAAGAGTGFIVRFAPRWAVFSRLEAMIPLTPRQYRHGDLLLYQTAPVTARAALGIEFRWGGQFFAEPGKASNE